MSVMNVNRRMKAMVMGGAALALLPVSGCETLEGLDPNLVGAAAGLGSGYLSYQLCKERGGDENLCIAIGLAAGTAIGLIARDAIGQNLNEDENARRNAEIDQATRTGQSQTYQTDEGNVGQIVPTNTYTNAEGHQCRSTRETITLGGETQEVVHNRCVDEQGKTYIDS